MRLRHYLLLGLTLALSAACAHASTIPPDPAIIVDGGGLSMTITTTAFSLTTPTGWNACTNSLFGAGLCIDIFNGSGVLWPQLLFNFPLQAGTVSCASQLFTSCATTSSSVIFTGGPGVLPQDNGGHIIIGVFNFPVPTTFNVTVVPEPATLGLFLTGLGTLFTGRALRRRGAPKKS